MRNVFCLLLLFFLISTVQAAATDSTKLVIVSKITLEGNKVTRPRIIQRELTLKVSDTLTIQQLYAEGERSRRNLMNTGLFNFVFVAFQIDDSSHAAITYTFKEAWYTWPVPIFELLERNPNQWWKDGANFNRANYGLYLTQYNFRGRKETLSIGFRGGYTQSYNVSYSVPYINKKQSIGMGFTYSYSQNHEIAYVLLNNKENYYRDEANLVRWQQGYSLRLTYRDGLYQYHQLMLNYRRLAVNEKVIKLNPDFFGKPNTSIAYPSISYSYRLDRRDFRSYPLNGYQLLLDAAGAGLYVSKDIKLIQIQAEFQRFQHIWSKLYAAAAITGHYSVADRQPYFTQQAFGYNDNIRGYEYYVINGQHFSLLNTNIRWALLQNKVLKLKFIPLEKFNTIPNSFYLNVFYDAGYVVDNYYQHYNPLSNQLLYGYGAGIDYSTYYYITGRFEYSINKAGEQGFFLNFKLSI